MLRKYLSYGRDMQVKYGQRPKIGHIGTIEMKDYNTNLLTFNPEFISDKQTITFDIYPTDEIELLIGV